MPPTMITLTGKYELPDETPASGTVTVTPAVRTLTAADKTITIPTSISKKLTNTGTVPPLAVIASDASGVAPANVPYHVNIALDNATPWGFDILVPAASPGGTLDLTTVDPLVSPPPLLGGTFYPNTIGGFRWRDGASSSNPPTYPATGWDGRSGLVELKTTNPSGFLFHISSGTESGQTAGGQIFGLGVGDDSGGGGRGILYDVRGGSIGGAGSQGLEINTYASLTGSNSAGLWLAHGATDPVPGMSLHQSLASVGPVIDMFVDAAPSAGQKLFRWQGGTFGGNNIGGWIDSNTGQLVSEHGGIAIYNSALLEVLEASPGTANASRVRYGVQSANPQSRFYRWAGAGTSFYCSAVVAGPAMTQFQQASAAAAIGAESMDTILALLQGRNVGINTTTEFGSGFGVIGIANAGTIPTTNPANGGVFFCQAGALKYRGSSGTVTTLAVA